MARNSSKSKRRYDVTGFTLVELVITIAVLAILSGIGALGYSGYITKANEAHDLALLSAVNTAFQSAYTEAEVSGYPKTAEATLDGSEGALKLSNLTASNDDGTEEISGFYGMFQKYFEGNEDAVFKVYTGLEYGVENGVFSGKLGDGTIVLTNGWKMIPKDNGNGTMTYTVTDDKGNEYEYTLNNASLEAYDASTFGQNMTASELMKDIDNVAETFANFLNDKTFSRYASKFADALGVTLDEGDPDYYKKLGNAMVLGVADASFDGGFDANSIADEWISNGRYSVSLNPNNLPDMAAKIALGYALATGYANSSYGQTEYNFGGETMSAAEYYKQQTESFSGKTGMDAFQAIQTMLGNMIGSDGYKEYYAAAGESDIGGYLGALDAIKNNRSTLESGNNVVNNAAGFSDDDLGSILDAIFGSGD